MSFKDLREYVHARSLADKTLSLKAPFPFLQQCYDPCGGRVYTLASTQLKRVWVTQITKWKRDAALRQGDDTLSATRYGSVESAGSAYPADSAGGGGEEEGAEPMLIDNNLLAGLDYIG